MYFPPTALLVMSVCRKDSLELYTATQVGCTITELYFFNLSFSYWEHPPRAKSISHGIIITAITGLDSIHTFYNANFVNKWGRVYDDSRRHEQCSYEINGYVFLIAHWKVVFGEGKDSFIYLIIVGPCLLASVMFNSYMQMLQIHK